MKRLVSVILVLLCFISTLALPEAALVPPAQGVGVHKPGNPGLDTTLHETPNPGFTFVVATDMRYFTGLGPYDTSQYFRGAVEAIQALGGGAFMLSPGDIDPPANSLWTITQTLGVAYTWYPVVGNHELVADYLSWLNQYDLGAVNPGPSGCPATTYSFDYQDAHFAILNEYCDSTGEAVTDGDVPDHLVDWLASDLAATDKTRIYIIGHEPAFVQPDADNGRLRHETDSLNQYPDHRDRFWSLLRDQGVIAYLCGHTHNYSAVKLDGVWQLDAGHARGLGDTGARSTFILIHSNPFTVWYETYRDDAQGGSYTPMHTGFLLPPPSLYLPLVLRR